LYIFDTSLNLIKYVDLGLFQGQATSVKIAANLDIVIGGYALSVNDCAPHLCLNQGLNQDAFLLKYAANGTMLAASSLGANYAFVTKSIELIEDRYLYNVLITGNNYVNRLFVALFDVNFNVMWHQEMDGAAGIAAYKMGTRVEVVGIRYTVGANNLHVPSNLALFEFNFATGHPIYQSCFTDQIEYSADAVAMVGVNYIWVAHKSYSASGAPENALVWTIVDATQHGATCSAVGTTTAPATVAPALTNAPTSDGSVDAVNAAAGPSKSKTAGVVIIVLLLFAGTGFGAWYCIKRRRTQSFAKFDEGNKANHGIGGEESFVSENDDILTNHA